MAKLADFSALLSHSSIAVGLSGGADSTALTHQLCVWSDAHNGPHIHALIIDHDLRLGSKKVAQDAYDQAKLWPKCTPSIHQWQGQKPKTGLMNAAREARYALMQTYCKAHAITLLCTAHHADDQLETFFIRLSKGSGLDGLSCMAPQTHKEDLILFRPLLAHGHDDLISYCLQHRLDWFDDPGNDNLTFERNRLRQSLQPIIDEGLNAQRIMRLTQRMQRAKTALDQVAEHQFHHLLQSNTNNSGTNNDTLTFDWVQLRALPDEIILRIMIKAITLIHPNQTHPIRLEKLETLCLDMLASDTMPARSLAHCLIKTTKQHLTIRKEA